MICVIIPYWKISVEVLQSRPPYSPFLTTTSSSSSSSFLLPFLPCSSDPQADGKLEEEEEEEEGGDQTHGNLKREEEIQLRTEEEGNVCNQMISPPKATL